jgi:hypothetical protein
MDYLARGAKRRAVRRFAFVRCNITY